MGAAPNGVPGWPELARCTASMDRHLMVLTQRSSMVIYLVRRTAAVAGCVENTIRCPVVAVNCSFDMAAPDGLGAVAGDGQRSPTNRTMPGQPMTLWKSGCRFSSRYLKPALW